VIRVRVNGERSSGTHERSAMLSDVEAMRFTAENYRRLAERQSDVNESRKFRAYASIYDELAPRRGQSAYHEEPSMPVSWKRSG
jgi:hypothetical protein